MVDANLRLDIADLYAAYTACLDEQRYDEWPEFFTENCVYKLIPRENYDAGLPLATMAFESKSMLKDRVYAVTQTLFHAPYYQRHIVGAPRITDNDDNGVHAEASYLVVRTKRSELSEVFNAGRYIDRVVSTSDGLRFARKLCVFDSEMIPNSIIYPI